MLGLLVATITILICFQESRSEWTLVVSAIFLLTFDGFDH